MGGSAFSAPSGFNWKTALVEGAPPPAVPMGGRANLPSACSVSDTPPRGASAGGCMMKRPPIAAASAPPPVTIAACPVSSGDGGAPGRGVAACSAALGARAAQAPLGPAFTALLVAAPPAVASATSPALPASSFAANVDALSLSLWRRLWLKRPRQLRRVALLSWAASWGETLRRLRWLRRSIHATATRSSSPATLPVMTTGALMSSSVPIPAAVSLRSPPLVAASGGGGCGERRGGGGGGGGRCGASPRREMGDDGEGGGVGGRGEGGGAEGGRGGNAGGGCGGKIGLEMATTSCVAFRPRSAEICPATLSVVRLSESACASAAPPNCSTLICALSVSSEEEVAVTVVGNGTAAVDSVEPVTWRSTCTCTLPLSSL